MTNEAVNQLKEELEKDGFMKKSDFDSVLEVTKDLTIQRMLDHTECGNKDCAMCTMKHNIDGSAYERGAIAGLRISQKYPGVNFIN